MNKKFINGFLLASLVVGSSGFLSSCKDYDDDINQLRTEVAENKSAIQSIKDQISAGAILKNVAPNATNTGIVVTVSKNGTDQTFEIKNGVNGTNADVWDIRQNAAGEYVWAKNGELTNYPAQGPKGDKGDQGDQGLQGPASTVPGPQGPQGTPGAYWEPNADGTKLVKMVWKGTATDGKYDPADPAEEIEIAIKVEAGKTPSITAVNDGSNVILNGVQTGVDEATGEPVYGSVTISCSGLLTGIGFIPQLYVDGVEGTRFAFVDGLYLTNVASGTTGTATINGVSVNFTIPGNDWAYNASTNVYQRSENAKSSFDLNPDNANIKGVDFAFLPIQNIEQVAASRAAAPALKVKGEPVVENGNLVVTYNVENPAAVTYGTAADATLPVTALKANLAAAEGETPAVVTSDYYSLVRAQVEFKALSFVGSNPDLHLASTGKAAIEQTEGKLVPVVYTQAEKYDLSKNVQICYIQDDFKLDPAKTYADKQMSLKEAAEKWDLTAKYAMMRYNIGDSNTGDSQYATVDENGVLSLQYLNASNQWVACGDNAASRSAIGRHPVVTVTLCDENGKVVLAGYVMFEITDKTAGPSPISNTGIILAKGDPMAYLCTSDKKVQSKWETTTSQVLSVLGISEQQFKERYALEAGTTYVKGADWTADKQTFVQVTNNKYGILNYNPDSQAGPTNGFLTWNYDLAAATEIRKLAKDNENATVELFVKFTRNGNANDNLYLGVEITILPSPSIAYGTLNPNLLVPGKTDEVEMSTLAKNNVLGKDVTYFQAALESYYTGEVIKESYTNNPGNAYPALSALKLPRKYFFAATAKQQSGLTVSADSASLYKGTDLIATIDKTTGVVKFEKSPASLALLNANPQPGVWAWVQIESKYCNEAVVDEQLDFVELSNDLVRIDFRRPVTVTGVNNYTVSPNGIDPSKEMLGNFFSMKDYFGNPLFTGNSTSGYRDYEGLFGYYKIQSIDIDLKDKSNDGVTFTVEGAGTPVNEVYTVKNADGTDLTAAVLNNVKVVCDYTTVVLQQTLTVKIPVTVNYYWGSQKVEATVSIKPNRNN